MRNSALCRGLLLPLIAITATLAGSGMSRAQTNDGTDLSIELVDPKVLRICADPRNLPFSNDVAVCGVSPELVKVTAVPCARLPGPLCRSWPWTSTSLPASIAWPFTRRIT